MTIDRSDPVLPQDLQVDENGQLPNFAFPVSQAEIEDLLYNEDIPATERLERLKSLRAELSDFAADDRGLDDPEALVGEIDLAIDRLSGDLDAEDETYPGLDMTLDRDPADHSETLAPDDDLRLGPEEEEDLFEDEPEELPDDDADSDTGRMSPY